MGNNNLDETAQADWSEINKLAVIKASINRNTELKYFSSINGRNPDDRLVLFVDKPIIDSTTLNQSISYM